MTRLDRIIETLRDFIAGSLVHANMDTRFAAGNADAALAKVETLLQAAESAEAHLPEQPAKAKRLLAAAVRNVKGEA